MSKRIIAFMLLIIFISSYFYNPVSAFFSDLKQSIVQSSTGSIGIRVKNLTLGTASLKKTGSPHGMIKLNSSQKLSFTVENNGISTADFAIELELGFEGELDEAGQLFLYNEAFSDEEILTDIIENDSSLSIISASTSDKKLLEMSFGNVLGIRTELLKGALLTGEQIAYSFNLFFFGSDRVLGSPISFQGREFELKVEASADIPDRDSLWKKKSAQAIASATIVDTVYPSIDEREGTSKVFFVSQFSNIDLASYAIASDPIEGDISHRMQFNAPNDLINQKAGVYEVEYNVKNNLGFSAYPLRLTIVLWDFARIESGNYHTLALTSHGKVYAWGFNVLGQLGDGTNTDRWSPFEVAGLDDIVDIATGTGSSFALNSEGQLYAWGRNENGRLGDGTTTNRNRPVPVQQPAGVKFVDVSTRFASTGALDEHGNVYTWGYGGYGVLGNGKSGDVTSPKRIDALSGIRQLEMGYYNGAAITNSGQLYTWGDNLNGQLGSGANPAVGTNAPKLISVGAGDAVVTDVSVGWYHMGAVLSDGSLYTWGMGDDGRLGNGSTADKNTPQRITLIEGVKALHVEFAYYHSAFIGTDGNAYFFGQNAYGKLGTGDTYVRQTPTLFGYTSNVTDISLALDSSFVLSDGKLVQGFGYGGTGVLGNGQVTSSSTPVAWSFIPPPPY